MAEVTYTRVPVGKARLTFERNWKIAAGACLWATTFFCTVGSTAGAEGERAPAVYRQGDYFEAVIPPAWGRERSVFGLSPEEKKVFGIRLTGPGMGEPVTIAAHYYAPGNLLDATAEKFIRIHSMNAPAGMKWPAVPRAKDGKVGGLNARLFSSVSIGHGGERRLDAPKIETWEGFVVLPLLQGYYVLRFSASPEDYVKWLPVFEDFIAAFKPLLK